MKYSLYIKAISKLLKKLKLSTNFQRNITMYFKLKWRKEKTAAFFIISCFHVLFSIYTDEGTYFKILKLSSTVNFFS